MVCSDRTNLPASSMKIVWSMIVTGTRRKTFRAPNDRSPLEVVVLEGMFVKTVSGSVRKGRAAWGVEVYVQKQGADREGKLVATSGSIQRPTSSKRLSAPLRLMSWGIQTDPIELFRGKT